MRRHFASRFLCDGVDCGHRPREEDVRRRKFIALMGASVVWPFAAMAQEPGRIYRLGVLFAAPRNDDSTAAFFEGVRRQGFSEGQNLTVIHHAFAMNPDRLPEWVAELVKARVDVIVTVGDLAIRTAQEALCLISTGWKRFSNVAHALPALRYPRSPPSMPKGLRAFLGDTSRLLSRHSSSPCCKSLKASRQ
jgi:hypothetical protein